MTGRNLSTMAAALLATTALAPPAFAQASGEGTIFKTIDDNGVDLVTGSYNLSLVMGSVGNGDQGLSMVEMLSGSTGHNLQMFFRRTESGGNATITITSGSYSETFTGAATATTFSSNQGSGASITRVNGAQYQLTTADGVKTDFISPIGDLWLGGDAAYCATGKPAPCDLLADRTYLTNGDIITYSWRVGENCRDRTLPSGEIVQDCAQFYRQSSVRRSSGFRIEFTYVNNTDPTTYAMPVADWYRRSGATYWNGTTQVAVSSITRPSTTVTELTDIGGRTWRVTRNSSQQVTGVRRPGSASDNIAVTQNSNSRVTQLTRDGVSTSYNYLDIGSTRETTITNALSQQTVVTSSLSIGRPTSIRDSLNRTTGFQYDSNARLTRTTQPEGNYVQLTYDARGNVTQTRAVAKSGSGLADIVTSASFPSTCTNLLTCNQPASTTDARGNVTDYTYDAFHGGVLTVTAPAPSAGAVRPQTRFSYAPVSSAGGQSVVLPSGVSQCQTQASCTGAADETKTTVAYNSNLLPVSVSRGDGTGTLTATQAMTYDLTGNLLTVDGPLAGTADTVRFRYDSARQLVGTIDPDPDGAGSLRHRATRTTWRPDGQASRQELGTVNGLTDPDWAAFVTLETVDVTFDANSRPRTQALSGTSGGTQALTQISYDAIGRIECTAVRMNPAVYGSLPASACTLGTEGAHGPDRISRTLYDAAGQVTQRKVALGTSAEANERTLSYSSNGMLATLTDGESNRTTYEYDGFDRLAKTRFPVTTQGANASSTTDYEQLGYDAASNVTSFRNRAAETIAFGYDNLDRRTSKNLPGGEPDVTYAYDLLGRMTSASQTGSSLSFTYDALGRTLTETSAQGTVTSTWDIAGRRTRLNYPGSGLFVDHDHFVTGEVTNIRENGATSGVGVLATYAYDDLRRRTTRTYGNGVSQAFAYDPVSRLANLTNDLPGTSNDLTIGLIAYNPASQIIAQMRSNDAYSFTGLATGSTAYVANGLNQLTSIGGAATTYDTKGNLTSDPATGKTYGYSSENLLTAASGGVALSYDPLLRLREVASIATTRFGYDRLAIIAEYDATNVVKARYVHGPSIDEPLVHYQGSGTTDRRFLSSDERGSIISVTDSSGGIIAINRYDDYGLPQTGNVGRFQYTGQAWIGELAAYYYKARVYSPAAGGRFLQTDPIGYDDGSNLYAYVGNDPVNFVDPLGLKLKCAGVDPGPLYCSRADGPGGGWGGDFLDFNYGRFDLPSLGEPVLDPTLTDSKPPPPPPAPREKKLSSCQKRFLRQQLSARGLPTDHLNDVKFVRGMDANANVFSRMALSRNQSVTQGNIIYVPTASFERVANFRDAVGFEEVIHTSQFRASGATFYNEYGLSSIGGLLTGMGLYSGNVHEAFAKGLANELAQSSQYQMCK